MDYRKKWTPAGNTTSGCHAHSPPSSARHQSTSFPSAFSSWRFRCRGTSTMLESTRVPELNSLPCSSNGSLNRANNSSTTPASANGFTVLLQQGFLVGNLVNALKNYKPLKRSPLQKHVLQLAFTPGIHHIQQDGTKHHHWRSQEGRPRPPVRVPNPSSSVGRNRSQPTHSPIARSSSNLSSCSS